MSNVVEKIRKLFALARDKGATEHESNVAMEMAQRLMLQHNITDVEEERVVEAIIGERMGVNMGETWELWVSSGVAMLYNCRSLNFKLSGDHQFVGKPENIEACQETFLWVCAQIEVLYKEALKSMGKSLGRRGRADLRASFKQAAGARVNFRCQEIAAKMRNDIPGHMALVVIDQSLAAADDLIKGVKKAKPKKMKYGIGTHLGHQAGESVRLQGGVGETRKLGN